MLKMVYFNQVCTSLFNKLLNFLKNIYIYIIQMGYKIEIYPKNLEIGKIHVFFISKSIFGPMLKFTQKLCSFRRNIFYGRVF